MYKVFNMVTGSVYATGTLEEMEAKCRELKAAMPTRFFSVEMIMYKVFNMVTGEVYATGTLEEMEAKRRELKAEMPTRFFSVMPV